MMARTGNLSTFCHRGREVEDREFLRNIEWGSTVFTDAHQSYLGLSRSFAHYMIDHATEFVRGAIHTNGIENFWSLLKRSLNGTWTHVAAFHLERYCREQAWRFNNRKTSDATRFERVLAGVLGRRITYRRLCAIDDAGFMGKV